MTAQQRGDLLKDWAAGFAATGLVGVLLGVLGPFGSFFNGPAWQRMPYWLAMAWVGTLIYSTCTRLVFARPWPSSVRWGALAGLVCIASVPFAALSWWTAVTIWPLLKTLPGLTPVVWYGEVLIIATPQVIVRVVLLAGRQRKERATPGGSSQVLGDLLGVEPSAVLCLSMEDHYVRVHTAQGSRLILATLSQAVATLRGAPGLQVHRSWWVAEDAVQGLVAEGRNLRLQLANGITAPVARSSVAAVRAAGWIGASWRSEGI